MKKARGYYVLMCLGLLLLVAQTLMAQKVRVPIHATDNVGAVTIAVGFDPAATNHIDPSLGEEEQPVEPPGGSFDARSITILAGLGRDTCLLGLIRNLHRGLTAAQSDRWRISFKSDSSGDSVTFTWPAHLADSAGGKWTLQDGSGGSLFPDVDMTTQTAFTYPARSLGDQYVFIRTADAQTYRTFMQEEIALALDSHLKTGKAEKRKAYQSYGCFDFANPNQPTDIAVGLHVEFDQAVVGQPLSYAPFTTATNTDAGKGKKWDFTNPAGPVGATVSICTYGNKGKTPKAKKYWWLDGSSAIVGGKLGPATLTASQLFLKMPNPNNVGEELYIQQAFPTGLLVGIGPDKQVTHPKWKDVVKTLYSKKAPGFVHTGAPRCLDDVVKLQKSLPADKHNNKLLAEAIALKINIAASLFGKTQAGLGLFTYVGGRYNGKTLQRISELCDTALSCVGAAAIGSDPDSMLQLYNVVRAIDSAFSGPFDTIAFGSKIVMDGVRSASDVAYLHKPPGQVPLVIVRPFVDPDPIPATMTVRQNYPNPFNPTTAIEFSLPEDAVVTLKIYNILGQEMATLYDHEALDAGGQTVDFDASALPSGVYFYRVVAQSVTDDASQIGNYYTSIKKMMLLK